MPIQRVEELLEAQIQMPSQIDRTHPVVVYGAGNCGRQVCSVLREDGYEVIAFLDRNGQGQTVDDVPCLSPRDQRVDALRQAGATVVIGAWNYAADNQEIGLALGHDWRHVVPFPDWYELFHAQTGEHFWLAPRQSYLSPDVQRDVLAAARLWSDEQSRDLFARAIECRLNGDLELVDAPARAYRSELQYFPADVSHWPSPTRFVDCGAFDGDTLRTMPRHDLRAVAAFEPDLRNFQKLSQWAQITLKDAEAPQYLLWPCGAWHETTLLRFASGLGTSSRVDETAESVVPVVALDESLVGFRPDFIKMDIEGAELSALLGARKIISAHRPALAVCVYHQASHLWQMALQIDSWHLEYEFFLRAHTFNGFEWVLYARPL